MIAGWLLNYFLNLLLFPLFGMHISLVSNLVLGSLYTGISVVRSYSIRRWFNRKDDVPPSHLYCKRCMYEEKL